MARARLHIICGNCGCNDLFSYTYHYDEWGDNIVRIICNNCSTIHDLEDNAMLDSEYKYDSRDTSNDSL